MWTMNGLEWSNWFPFHGKEKEKWQLKNKLRNEYMDVANEEWLEIDKSQHENIKKKYND